MMVRIKYDLALMKLMTLFEQVTRAKVKDLIGGDQLLFIVQPGDMGKAIGKGGQNIKRLELKLKKKVKIVEFNDDVELFIKNMVYPLQPENIEQQDKVVTITGKDMKTKGLLIGRDRKNLKALTEIVKRYFDVEEIKVA